jgi:hypothetical protein
VLHAPGGGGTSSTCWTAGSTKASSSTVGLGGLSRGIDFVGLELKIVVASIETYLRDSDALGVGLRIGERHQPMT